MQGLAWPLSPVIGQVVKGFRYDGKAWQKAKPTPWATWSNVQRFTASGRYTPSDNLVYIIVECWGAGGGGGWATRGTGVLTGNAGSGGGGSGGYSKSTIPAELVSQGADVVVAPGLLVGFSQTGWQFALDTTFGGLVVAKGGQNAMPYDGLGVTGVVPSFGQPGNGAPAGTGDLAFPGACGCMWNTCTSWQVSSEVNYLYPGIGGQIMGGNLSPVSQWNPNSNVNGLNGAPNSGAGGGGAVTASATTALGGAGGSGLVLVTEICSTDTESPGPGPEPPTPGPPGVPLNLNVKARVTQVPWEPDCGLHPMPVGDKR